MKEEKNIPAQYDKINAYVTLSIYEHSLQFEKGKIDLLELNLHQKAMFLRQCDERGKPEFCSFKHTPKGDVNYSCANCRVAEQTPNFIAKMYKNGYSTSTSFNNQLQRRGERTLKFTLTATHPTGFNTIIDGEYDNGYTTFKIR